MPIKKLSSVGNMAYEYEPELLEQVELKRWLHFQIQCQIWPINIYNVIEKEKLANLFPTKVYEWTLLKAGSVGSFGTWDN